MKTTCDVCKNEAPLYWRRSYRLCEHCAALHENYSRCRAKDPNFLSPMNQPNALNNRPFPKPRPCVWCGISSRSLFRWKDAEVSACGWGCAGYWMDAQMERDALKEGMEYVKRSLGVAT